MPFVTLSRIDATDAERHGWVGTNRRFCHARVQGDGVCLRHQFDARFLQRRKAAACVRLAQNLLHLEGAIMISCHTLHIRMEIDVAISSLQLKMARAALNWGVRDLAVKAGISADSVTRAEQGAPEVTAKTWGAIQRAATTT